MIECNEIEPFLNKYISVGVPHDIIAGRLFFYYGILKYVDSIEIKLETKNGFKIIQIENIMDIHEKLGGGDDRHFTR